MKNTLLILLIFISFHNADAQKVNVKKEFDFVQRQTDFMQQQIKVAEIKPGQVSPRTFENGKLKMVSSRDWTSGFFPGNLWYLYEYTQDEKWLREAQKFTQNLEKEQFNRGTHDLGFMIYGSYGHGYRLTKDNHYKKIIIQAAKSLSTRFNPKSGVIKSWDHTNQFAVIIDNMMNLELLFEVTRLTGDSSFYKIAVSHADQTMKNHFREDNSTYHVLDYDTESENVKRKITAQGYSDDSAWARGQAWGLYGFIICYRETKDQKYLDQANKIAAFILNHPNLPKDLVPYWDYNDPTIPRTSKDASAAAITASALYELDGYAKNKGYKKKADKILNSLSKNYRSPEKENGGFILLHSTGHRPAKSEIDVPLIYADYYYLEALLRSKKK